VGAGDAMLAGVLVGLTEGRTLAAAVGYGVAAGSAALLHPGTTLCTREDTDRLALDVGEGVLVA
jgi:6-phosphofructokinase 2